MTTTTLSPARKAGTPRVRSATGFTLVEVMIAASIGSFVLLGMLTSFLFLARSGANLQNYTAMESEARKALEQFAQDTRQASAITWNSRTSITLVVDSANITYAFTSGSFTRATASATATLLTGITSFTYSAYDINGTTVDLSGLASAGRSTKQLQISLQASRSSITVVGATNTVLSARFILRNKRITA